MVLDLSGPNYFVLSSEVSLLYRESFKRGSTVCTRELLAETYSATECTC